MGRKTGSLNKVQKPKKEPKTKGRPKGSKNLKQKQKQQQHQIVNINIGSRTAQQNEKRKKKKEEEQQRGPMLMFNPSLSLPSFGINTRQPVNTPLLDIPEYNANDILQKIPQLQTIKQQIKESIGQTIGQPIGQTIGQGTQEPITNTPYIPISQDEHSRPIPPELIMEPTTITEIQNKHQKHKDLVKELKPQLPKQTEIKPTKYIDTEGLGNKIPISKIGELATAIGTGALTGGVTVAGEALLTGGLAALTAESIGGAAVGGGVGAGVFNALGNTGQVGHIVSGIVGGIAGRAGAGARASRTNDNIRLGRVRRPRQNRDEHPLLFRGQGNRTGGDRSGRSRLVPEIQEVQETHDPQTGERTRWVLPQETQTMVQRIRTSANRTMRNVSDTVSNFSNQISETGQGIIQRVRGPGRPRLAPRSDEDGWEPYPEQAERPLGPVIRDIEASNKLKAALKRTKQQNITAGNMRWENEMAQNEQNRAAAGVLQNAIRRNKDRNNHAFDIIGANNLKDSSASTLQAAIKRTNTKAALKKEIAIGNMQELSGNLNSVAQYGKSQDVLNEFKTKRQAINNLGELATKATTSQRKTEAKIIASETSSKKRIVSNLGKLSGGIQKQQTTATLEAYKKEMPKRFKAISNLGQLANNANAATRQQTRQSIMAKQDAGTTELFGGLKSGKVRAQEFKERNPELDNLRQRLSDNKRGKNSMSSIEVEATKERIKQIVDLNKAMQAKGMGAKVGRPKKK